MKQAMTSTPSLQALKEKADEINSILQSPTVDLWKLRELALSEGGLVNDTLRKRAWPKLVGLHRFYHLPRATTTGTTTANSPKNNRSRNSTPHKRPRPIGQEVQAEQERSSPSPVQTNTKRTKHQATPLPSNTDHNDRFLDGDELFANGLAPPSTTSVPNHDPRDYYNLIPQMEIDASVVVAADQAAEEAAAAAQQKLRRRVDSGSLDDDSAVEVYPTNTSEDSATVEPLLTPRAGSSSKPPSLKSKQNPPKLPSFRVSSPSGAPPKESSKPPTAASPTVIVECKDAVQIHRDVVRCTWHLLTGTQRSRRLQYKHKDRRKVGSLLHRKQFRLANLLNWTLFQSSYTQQQQQQILGGGGAQPVAEDVGGGDEESLLRYYQGFHDVACIFMATLGDGNQSSITTGSPSKEQRNGNDDETDSCAKDEVEEQEWEKIHPDERLRDLQEQAMALGLDLPSRVLLQLSYSHFRDNLRSTFVQLQTALRIVLFPLLHALDPHGVHAHLVDCDMEPFFCLSWVITWFAHDVRDTELVKRLFDVFIVSHPLFPIYLSIAMLLHPVNRRMILTTDCDFAAVHHCLTMLPRNSCRVGWKKRKQVDGDDEDAGYVSDDGEPQSPAKRTRRRESGQGDSVSRQSGCDTDDDGTLSTDLDVSLLSDGWGSSIPLFERQQQRRGDADADDDDSKDDGHSSSMLSGSLLSASPNSVGRIGMIPDNERVPFQELIETAIKYMRRYPPRCLVPLARAYYKTDMATANSKDHANMSYYETGPRERMVMQPPMTDEMWNGVVNTITILQPTPPIWSITPFTKADWVLKQRARERMGLSSTSRKDRRNIAKQKAVATKDAGGENVEEEDDGAPMPLVDYDFIRKNCDSRAVIACGFGTGEEDERKRRRRQRLVLATTSVLIVGLVAISVGYILNSYSSTNNSATTKSTSSASTSSSQSGSATGSDATSSTRTTCIDNDSCGQLDRETIFETGGNKCFDPIALPSFTSMMTSSLVDTRYEYAADSNDGGIGDSVPDTAVTAESSAQETSVSVSVFKPMTNMLGHVTLRMHRVLHEMRMRWEANLFEPLRQMYLPGFLEEGSLFMENFKPLTNVLGQVTLRMHRVLHEVRQQWKANLFEPLSQMRLPGLLEEGSRKETFKPLINVLEHVKPRMHRFLHELRMQWETKLFQPLRQTRLPGFLEEEFVEETSLGNYYDVPTVLGYARELATGAHEEVRRCLDTVGINMAFFSRISSSEDERKDDMEGKEVVESKDDLESKESYNDIEDHSAANKSHRRELSIKRVVRSAASAMDSWKTNVAEWRERAREHHRAEQAAGNEDYLPLY